MKKFLVLAAACVLVGGCAELEQDLRQVHDYLRKLRGRDPAPPPPAPPAAAELPVAALNLNGNCVGKEETGYAANVRVTVAAGQVRALEQRLRGAHVAAGRPHHGRADRLRGQVHGRGLRIRLAGPVQRRRGLLLKTWVPA